MTIVIIALIAGTAGFIGGILVGRRNRNKVDAAVNRVRSI